MRDATLKKIVADFRKGILDGRDSKYMCFAVCAPLQGYLSMIGYKSRLVQGEIKPSVDILTNHYWLELPDGRIVDPTADQFSTPERPMPQVYIGKLPEWYHVEEKVQV
jgi:hypothetical protein